MKILVTGAGGRTGQAIVPALVGAGHAVRVFVRRAESGAELRALGAAEVAQGDLNDDAAVTDALQDIDALYHIPPTMSPDEIAIGQRLIAAAKSVGLGHFVYYSVLHPQIQGLPHHWNKLFVEEALIESGLPYTILQPCSYMQNTMSDWKKITGEGVHTMAFSVDRPLSLIDLADVAAVAAVVTGDPAHHYATYELAGPTLSVRDKARILSDVLGREVRAVQETITQWKESALAGGMPAHMVEGRAKMFAHYDETGLAGNPGILEWLLGRAATSFAAFVTRAAKEKAAAVS
jgi:uncharacterized protein YbjT (DUF2867 family)